MDLGRCFFRLTEAERDALLSICGDLEVEPEAHPDVVRLVRDGALKRLTDSLPGPRGDAWERAAARLGLDPATGSTARRRIDFLRQKSGEKRRDTGAERAQVSGTS